MKELYYYIPGYVEWRKVSEEMILDGFPGTTDAGDPAALESFNAWLDSPDGERLDFESFRRLEEYYNYYGEGFFDD